MKTLRKALPLVLISLSTVMAFAQSDAQKSSVAPVPYRGAEVLRNHEKPGGRVGRPRHGRGDAGDVRRQADACLDARDLAGKRPRARIPGSGTPLDATKYDHPVTMLYVDGDQLTLVHYCDAGNRPRMTGKMSPDGKTVEFELKDISGSTEHHMHHSVFTIIDANHHTEDWTFMMKDKPIHAHFDLHRTN